MKIIQDQYKFLFNNNIDTENTLNHKKLKEFERKLVEMTKFNTTNNNNNQKEQHLFSLTFRSLLCIRLVDCSLLVWRSVLKKGLLFTNFCPTLYPRSRNAQHICRAMISLSLQCRGETIYRWYWGTEALIWYTVRGGLESIRICLSEIFWLNLHRIRFFFRFVFTCTYGEETGQSTSSTTSSILCVFRPLTWKET